MNDDFSRGLSRTRAAGRTLNACQVSYCGVSSTIILDRLLPNKLPVIGSSSAHLLGFVTVGLSVFTKFVSLRLEWAVPL